MSVKHAAFLLLLASLIPLSAPVEGQITGAIRGTVMDASGAVLPGVSVTVRSPALVRGEVTVVTDSQGNYRVPALQPGTYELVAELTGFVTATVADIAVGLEQEVVVNLTLQLAGVQETVTVKEAVPLIEGTISGLRERIDPQTIETMPLKGRQFLDLVALVPGTAPRPPDVEEGAEVSVLGGRSTTNGFLIDGMQNRDDFSGGFKEFFVQDAIQEFNVNIAGFMPEHGLASGAVINIITKSGTNDFKGRAFLFTRNDALDASNVPGRTPRSSSATTWAARWADRSEATGRGSSSLSRISTRPAGSIWI